MAPKDMSYMSPTFPIVGFIGFVLCLLPVPAHWRAGNIAVITLAGWISIGLLMVSLNAIIWHGNIRNPHPVWGDICNQFYVMLPNALASCILCIQYRLWSIARAKTVFITKREKTRQKYATYFCCLGFPILIAVIHYVVQGHRYNIIEDVGPLADTYNVTLAYPLYSMWETLLCSICAVFSILTIRLFLARRREFDAVLDSGSNNVNKDRYLRLLFLSAISICIHLPLAAWVLILNAAVFKPAPWISWEDTHSNYGRIMYVNRFSLSLNPSQVIYMSLAIWPLAISGYTFFLFFGFGEEASKQYQSMIGAVLKPFGIKYPKERKRQMIKKTWLDVLLCRPGRPINLTSSAPTSSIPQFTTNPSDRPSTNKNAKPSTRSQTTSGGNDLNIDISNLDFLDPAEAKKQARISAYTRPGQAVNKGKHPQAVLPKKAARRASVDSSLESFDESESSDITDEKQDATSPSTSTGGGNGAIKEEVDLEAQEAEANAAAARAAAEERRREILAANPELTEEVTF